MKSLSLKGSMNCKRPVNSEILERQLETIAKELKSEDYAGIYGLLFSMNTQVQRAISSALNSKINLSTNSIDK